MTYIIKLFVFAFLWSHSLSPPAIRCTQIEVLKSNQSISSKPLFLSSYLANLPTYAFLFCGSGTSTSIFNISFSGFFSSAYKRWFSSSCWDRLLFLFCFVHTILLFSCAVWWRVNGWHLCLWFFNLAPALVWHYIETAPGCKARTFSSLFLNFSVVFTIAKQMLF